MSKLTALDKQTRSLLNEYLALQTQAPAKMRCSIEQQIKTLYQIQRHLQAIKHYRSQPINPGRLPSPPPSVLIPRDLYPVFGD